MRASFTVGDNYPDTGGSWVKHTPQTVNLHWAVPMRLKKNEAFIHYCETAPSARGMNIYPAVLSRICNDFREKASIMISCNAKNSASIRGIEKAGFRERERVQVLIIMGIKRVKVLKS